MQPNKEFTVFVKWLPALAVLGVLRVSGSPQNRQKCSEALENLTTWSSP
ncbi:MAG: hypothetical protein ACLSHC_18290 [Bilophila wadsworthia]